MATSIGGTWANTLLRYEDLSSDLDSCLSLLHKFLGRNIISHTITDRDKLAEIDGLWIRKNTAWQDSINEKQLDLFNEINWEMMVRLGYLNRSGFTEDSIS